MYEAKYLTGKGKFLKKWKPTVHGILPRVLGLLLALALLSIWVVGGLFAKYASPDTDRDTGRVAMDLPLPELWEHQAVLKDGVYVLNNKRVTGNTYGKVIPGVDIAKDPFIVLSGTSEVDFELYVTVTEKNFPTKTGTTDVKTVTYALTNEWELVEAKSNAARGIYVYKYKTYFDAGSVPTEPIYILQDNQLIVSQYFDGSTVTSADNSFSLTFTAWVVQVD